MRNRTLRWLPCAFLSAARPSEICLYAFCNRSFPPVTGNFGVKTLFNRLYCCPFFCCPFFCCPPPCGNQKCDDQSCAFLMAYSAGKRMHGTHKACMISAKPGLSCRKFILQPVFSLLLRRLIFFFHMRHKAPFRRLCRSVRNTPKCRTAYLL